MPGALEEPAEGVAETRGDKPVGKQRTDAVVRPEDTLEPLVHSSGILFDVLGTCMVSPPGHGICWIKMGRCGWLLSPLASFDPAAQ